MELEMQGKKNPATDQEAVKSFLGLVKGAGEMSIDRYCLTYIQ
jgi:diacylglycerol kinase (ATP)